MQHIARAIQAALRQNLQAHSESAPSTAPKGGVSTDDLDTDPEGLVLIGEALRQLRDGKLMEPGWHEDNWTLVDGPDDHLIQRLPAIRVGAPWLRTDSDTLLNVGESVRHLSGEQLVLAAHTLAEGGVAVALHPTRLADFMRAVAAELERSREAERVAGLGTEVTGNAAAKRVLWHLLSGDCLPLAEGRSLRFDSQLEDATGVTASAIRAWGSSVGLWKPELGAERVSAFKPGNQWQRVVGLVRRLANTDSALPIKVAIEEIRTSEAFRRREIPAAQIEATATRHQLDPARLFVELIEDPRRMIIHDQRDAQGALRVTRRARDEAWRASRP